MIQEVKTIIYSLPFVSVHRMLLEKEDDYVGGKLLKTLQRNLPLKYILKDQEEFSRTGKGGWVGRTVLENTRI